MIDYADFWFPLRDGMPKSSVRWCRFSKLQAHERVFEPPQQSDPDYELRSECEIHERGKPLPRGTYDYVLMERGRATAIRLYRPNGWSAQSAFKKSFWRLHAGVPGMTQIQCDRIERAIYKLAEPVQRIGAISFSSTNDPVRLLESKGRILTTPEQWHWQEDQTLYLRYERQVVERLSKDSYQFSIGTYFVNLKRPEYIDYGIRAMSELAANPSAYYPAEWGSRYASNAEKFLRELKEKQMQPGYVYPYVEVPHGTDGFRAVMREYVTRNKIHE